MAARKQNSMAVVYILTTLSIFLWGFSYIWSNQLIARNIPIFFFVSIRVVIAGIVLFLFNKIKGCFQAIKKKDLWKFLLLAGCEPFIYFIAETYGIKLTESPTISSVMIASVPIFSVAVGYFFFKEKFSRLNVFGVFVTLSGIALVLLSKMDGGVGKNFLWGILMLLVAIASEVIYASLTKTLSSDYTPSNITMYQFCIGGLYFLPLLFTKGIEGFDPSWFSWDVIRPILCLAVLCSSLSFALWADTIKTLGVAKSSVFLSMICVVTAVSAVITGQEMLTLSQWLGVAVSVVGIILTQSNIAGRKKSSV